MTPKLAALALGVSLSGGLCRRDPPPVLFDSDAGRPTVTATPDAAQDAETPPPTDAATGRPTRVSSVVVSGDGSSLTQDGVTLRAARGERFLRYLPTDLDADGDSDLVVSVAHGTDAAPLGRLYRRDPGGFVEAPLTELQAAPLPSCVSLDMHANSTRTAVLSWTCPPPPPSGTTVSAGSVAPNAQGVAQAAQPAAVHLVVGLSPAASVRLRVEELAPALGATVLAMGVDAFDRDADGRDDAVVDVTVRRPSDRAGQGAHVQLVYFDRPAGMARDVTEPERSWAALGTLLRGHSRRRVADAWADFERAVRLRRVLCSESGLARVRINGEVGVACAGSAGLRTVLEGAVRALLSMGEQPAAAALLRSEVSTELLGTTVADRALTELRRALGPELPATARMGGNLGPVLDAANITRATALQLDPPSSPTRVVLRGALGGAVELSSLTVQTAEPGSPLDLQPVAPDGSLALQGFYQTCAGVVAALCPATASECRGFAPRPNALPPGATAVVLQDLPSPDLAARCLSDTQSSDPATRAADLRALGWGREGLLVVWRGWIHRIVPGATQSALLGPGAPLGGPFPAGSSASASGDNVVVGAPEGLFVRASGRWQLWSAPNLVGRAPSMTDLTVSDDGNTVVGLLGTTFWLVRRGAPALDATTAATTADR